MSPGNVPPPGKLPALMMPIREPSASRRAPPAGLSCNPPEPVHEPFVPGKSTQSAFAMFAGATTWYCPTTEFAPAVRT